MAMQRTMGVKGVLAMAAGVAGLACSASSASAVVFFDGVFNNADWSITSISNAAGAGSSQIGFQLLTGGNPNEFRRIRNNLVVASSGGGSTWGINLNANSFYTPSSQGVITNILYSEDSIAFGGPGNVQGGGLAILQGGRYYLQVSPTYVMPLPTYATWQSQTQVNLTQSLLWELTPSGTLNASSNPDFSITGGTMQFGFYRGNSNNGSVQTDAGIDNWRVEVVPAPGAAALLMLGGLVAGKRRRR